MAYARSALRAFFLATTPILLIFGLQLSGSAEGQKTSGPPTLLFRSPLPLGADGYVLRPLNRKFFLMASADNPEFNMCRVTRVHLGGTVVGPDGTQMRHYPQ